MGAPNFILCHRGQSSLYITVSETDIACGFLCSSCRERSPDVHSQNRRRTGLAIDDVDLQHYLYIPI
jgi:hypothetical protein